VKAFACSLVIIAVVLSMSSVAWGALTVIIVASALHAYRIKPRVIATGMVLVSLSLVVLYLWQGAQGYDSARRFEAYRIFMGEWWEHQDHVVFGFGPGSFPALNRLIQTKHHFMIEKDVMWNWLWLHSDWLQSAFELGVVGCCLYVTTAISVLWHLWRTQSIIGRDLFAMASGLCATAALNYPARYFICAFLMMFVAVASRRIGGTREQDLAATR
jgi:O-antigen ligase